MPARREFASRPAGSAPSALGRFQHRLSDISATAPPGTAERSAPAGADVAQASSHPLPLAAPSAASHQPIQRFKWPFLPERKAREPRYLFEEDESPSFHDDPFGHGAEKNDYWSRSRRHWKQSSTKTKVGAGIPVVNMALGAAQRGSETAKAGWQKGGRAGEEMLYAVDEARDWQSRPERWARNAWRGVGHGVKYAGKALLGGLGAIGGGLWGMGEGLVHGGYNVGKDIGAELPGAVSAFKENPIRNTTKAVNTGASKAKSAISATDKTASFLTKVGAHASLGGNFSAVSNVASKAAPPLLGVSAASNLWNLRQSKRAIRNLEDFESPQPLGTHTQHVVDTAKSEARSQRKQAALGLVGAGLGIGALIASGPVGLGLGLAGLGVAGGLAAWQARRRYRRAEERAGSGSTVKQFLHPALPSLAKIRLKNLRDRGRSGPALSDMYSNRMVSRYGSLPYEAEKGAHLDQLEKVLDKNAEGPIDQINKWRHARKAKKARSSNQSSPYRVPDEDLLSYE